MVHIRLFIVEIAGVALFACSLMTTLSFLAAETPQQAALRKVAKMPPECEAGVLNHGSYYCWLTIHEHPFLFALSVVGIVGGGVIVAQVQRRWFPSKAKNDA